VLAVQHCPLVHADAVANFERHGHVLDTTVLHRSKNEMVSGIHHVLQHCVNQPVVGVITGGRKGLDVSYVEYLLKNKDVCAIVYNSCSTKSLLRDMERFIQGGFMVEDFKSYDFLPGTGYTASLTLLKRRPRTLIIPVGPAGVGKSTLAKTLVNQIPRIKWWQRDVVFRMLRDDDIGLNKTRQLVHNDLLTFLRQTDDSGVFIVDSTNGSAEARQLYMNQAKPDRTVLVALQPVGDDQQICEFLLNRTRNRLDANDVNHPSFPNTVDEQRKKHLNILKGICYPVSQVEGCDAVVLLVCDPQSSNEMTALPFNIFLEFSTSKHLRLAVRSKLSE
jgi:predicted kinase